MNLKEKLLIQTVICLMFFAGIRGISMIDTEHANKAEKIFFSHIESNYSISEVKAAASDMLEELSGAGETVMTAVMKANTSNSTANPLGKKDENGIQIVYAASGGNVIGAGISEDIGLYVKIQSEDKMYTYGNLEDISVVPGERARKGDIIGTFDSKSKNVFTFEID